MKTTATRLLVGAATAGTVLALSFGIGATAAVAATPTPSPSTATSAPATSGSSTTNRVTLAFPLRAVGVRAVRLETGSVPAALHTDITALKGKKGHDRREAVQSIETKAVGGGYGSAVESIAKEATTAWASAPTGLQKDLRALRGDSTTARRAGLAAIEAKALKGDYGTAMQHYATTVKAAVDGHLADTEATDVGAIV